MVKCLSNTITSYFKAADIFNQEKMSFMHNKKPLNFRSFSFVIF